MSVESYNILDTWQFFKRVYWTRCCGQYPSLRRNLRTFNVFRALEAMRTLSSTNPQDRIYAISALFDIGLEVNYQATVEQVFTEFASIAKNTMGRPFECLSEAGRQKRSLESLPSWVPDWLAKPVWTLSGLNKTPRKAAGDISPSTIAWDDGQDTLWVKGAITNTITVMTEPLNSGQTKTYWQPEKIGSMELNEILSSHTKARIFVSKSDTSSYHSEADRLVALIRILCLDDF